MSDEIKGDLPKSSAEAAKYRRLARDRKARVEELEAKLVSLETERDNAVKALKDAPGEAAAKIAELEGQIRTRIHRDAFQKLAAGKIKVEAVEDAYSLSGWKADADQVDEAKLTEAIDTLLASREYLKAEEAKSEPAESGESAPVERSFNLSGSSKPKPVTGAGRGPAPEVAVKNQQSVWKL